MNNDRLNNIVVDAVFEGIEDFNKSNYIDTKALEELNKQIDIDFGTNLCNLNNNEKLLWYFMYNYIHKLNKKITVDELINIGYIYMMTI